MRASRTTERSTTASGPTVESAMSASGPIVQPSPMRVLPPDQREGPEEVFTTEDVHARGHLWDHRGVRGPRWRLHDLYEGIPIADHVPQASDRWRQGGLHGGRRARAPMEAEEGPEPGSRGGG